MEGWGGHVQSGALRALAATRRDEAVPLLLDRVPYGATTNRARPSAVIAIGSLGRLQERAVRSQIAEALIDRLADPVQRVRSAAVGALQLMGATEALGALDSARGPLSAQERVRVDRAMRTIRASEKPKTAAVEKQLDELRTVVRKLKDSVESLEAKMLAAGRWQEDREQGQEEGRQEGRQEGQVSKEEGQEGAVGRAAGCPAWVRDGPELGAQREQVLTCMTTD